MLTAWLTSHDVAAAAMGGTGIYWRAPWDRLRDAGDRVASVACAACEAVARAQDGCRGQPLAGSGVPVRPGAAERGAGSGVSRLALAEPPSPQPGPRTSPCAQPGAEDHRSGRDPDRRHHQRCVRRQRPDHARRPDRRGFARSNPLPAVGECQRQACGPGQCPVPYPGRLGARPARRSGDSGSRTARADERGRNRHAGAAESPRGDAGPPANDPRDRPPGRGIHARRDRPGHERVPLRPCLRCLGRPVTRQQ